MDLGDHFMEGVIDTTELSRNGHVTLDPAVLTLAPSLLSNDASMSPELARAMHNKITNGGQATFTRSPSRRQDTKPLSGKRRADALPYSTSVTGLVYDVRMRFHVEVKPEQNAGVHPEDPRRIWMIYSELVQAGLVDDPNSPGFASEYVLGRIAARQATREEICEIHTQRHFDWVVGLKDWDNERLHEEGQQMDSIYLSQNSPLCARLSAGGAIEACYAIMNKQVKNAIAVIRPPGHHAEHDQPMGFCFFNNVPIAAKACQRQFGDQCRKVFILDWDVHHGNGVQQAFYNDPNVLYISLHVHQGGRFYPSGNYGDHLHCGEDAGLGRNVNIPWKTAGMTDADYIYAFQQVVMPIAQDFAPDLVIVSAGFDAAEGDMLGKCHVSPAGYAHMTHMLMSLADGKVAVCLEGGYNLRSIAISALAVTRTLMGEPPDRLANSEPTASGVDTVQLVLRQQSKFWPCLSPKDPSKHLKDLKGERLHDIIREWQAKTLFENHEMMSLFIARSKLSRSFDHQVLATPNYTEPRPLLLIFHDPPEVIGIPDPRTQKLELHNTWLTDMVKTYVDWAAKQGFAVIDANVPRYLTGIEDDQEYAEAGALEDRTKQAFELASYLWENHIEIWDASHIFIMGVGTAYASIVQLLKANERCRDRISKIFSFISDQDAMHSYRSATDDFLDRWYRDVSLIFVAENHYIWEKAKTKAPSKRWGTLVQSPKTEIQEILEYHRDRVKEEIMELTEEWREEQKTSSGSSADELSTAQPDLSARSLVDDVSGRSSPAIKSPPRLPPIGNYALASPSRSKATSSSPGKR
ncbi:hypothetical protein MBLNU459_g3492t1 [Dothideomycetes sp. NU459]